jgi:Uma2 family endonuclease
MPSMSGSSLSKATMAFMAAAVISRGSSIQRYFTGMIIGSDDFWNEDTSVTAILEPPLARPAMPGVNGHPQESVGSLCWRIPTGALTLAGFRAWVTSDQFPEKARTTYVDQEIYLDLSKEEITTHAAVKAAISQTLMNLVAELGDGRFFLDGVLISNVAADVSNNPDGVYLSFEGLREGRFRLVPGSSDTWRFVEIEGTPDWVLEILSASSVEKDTVQLRRAYFQAGIPEYWLVDARGDEILFQILRPSDEGYAPVPVEDGWQASAVFKRSFRLERQQDAFGWVYKLLVRQ